jgi:hypothetical protein
MIPYNVHDAQLIARLDAEGTDSYGLNEDRITATNAAQYMLQGALNALVEKNKKLGESLRDLNWTAVFQTSLFGQVDIDTLLNTASINRIPHKLWTVLAVYPEFESAEAQTLTPDPISVHSMLRQDVRFTSPIEAAKHYTQQDWANSKKDLFAPGSPLMTNTKLKEYGYHFGTRAVANTGPVANTTLTVLGTPAGKRQLVAVSYLKVPEAVKTMPLLESDPLYTQTKLEWPESMAELLVSLTLRQMTYQVGDQTTLYQLTSEETGLLLNALN